MKKFFLKFTFFCLIIAIVFSMTGCLDLLFGPTYYPDEDLTIYEGQSVIRYEYSEKVAVTIDYDGNDDLEINGFTELECHFEKVAYNKGKLFIFTEEKYYMFDIDDYIEHYNNDHSYIDYEIHEYTINEFKELYPDYENFDWYGH